MPAGTATAIYRTLSRHTLYTTLNLIGLALGIAIFLTMALITRYEDSYDASVPNAAQIFQVDEVRHPAGHAPDESDFVSFVPFPFLLQDIPEIHTGIRVLQLPLVVRVGDTLNRETVTMTDRTFFAVFDLPLVAGDKATALDGPGKVVLSAAMARKYFGTINALGRRMRIDNGDAEAIVTGVLAPSPPNRSLHFDIIEVTPTRWLTKPAFTNWGSQWGQIWVKIDDPRAAPRINRELIGFVQRHPGNYSSAEIREEFGPTGGLDLIPLRGVHFHTAAIGGGGNSRALIRILGVVGLAALATALINYVNLATARSVLRAREIAIRKVMGGTRLTVMAQLLAEAIALVALAGVVGLALTEIALRWVSAWGGWNLAFDWAFLLPVTLLIVLVTGVLAGFYPALVLSAYQPAAVLAASKTAGGGRLESGLRAVLVVLQFSFAITLGICTLVMTQQATHIRTLDRGMKQSGLIVIYSLIDDSLRTHQKDIMLRLAAVPGVTIATRSDIAPHNLVDRDDWRRLGHSDKHGMQWGSATPGYFQAIGAHLIAGRLFDRQHGQDYAPSPRDRGNDTSVVISRLAAARFGFSSPAAAIGQEVQEAAGDSSDQTYRIIGVIDDIRFRTARSPMAPLLYFGSTGPLTYGLGLVRYEGVSQSTIMRRLHAAWQEVAPNVAFAAESTPDIFAEDYRTDADHGALFAIGSALAIGIACLGLYGLSTFSVSRRMHEIGIRKVMGARTRDILLLLTGQFLRPVLIANLIAWPLAWALMRRWLSSFDERIVLTPLPFIAVMVSALAIATLTVIIQTLRAAAESPASALQKTG